MFRRSAADLRGAALRVHITLTTGQVPGDVSGGDGSQMDIDSQEELSSEEEETVDVGLSPTAPKQSASTPSKHENKSPTPDVAALEPTEISMDESFPVSVSVDRAMHLSLKGEEMAWSLSFISFSHFSI